MEKPEVWVEKTKPEVDFSVIKPILILPTYNQWSRNRQAVVNYARAIPSSPIVEVASSCLGHCFNLGYQIARKVYAEGQATHAIMLHADVVPGQGLWGHLLLQEAERVQASIMSVVIPIKTHNGITSTAIERKSVVDSNGWHPIRFTMKEVMQLPETFTHPRLMVNTGLMVIDLRQEWAHELVFDLESKVDLPNYRPYFLPEDWKMSRFAQAKGATIWATRKVSAMHYGEVPFGNDKEWGSTATEGAMEIFLQEYDL
jgi:hypothetical protein